MPDQSDPLTDAFQTLCDLIERYGRERTEQQHEMWWQIENAMEELAEQGIAEGRSQAVAVIRRQADLPSLMHFDRPSDFRKGVLTCLAALEAEGKQRR